MQSLSARFEILLLSLFVFLTLSVHAQVVPGESWQTSDPSAQGLDPAKLEKAIQYLESNAGNDSVNELVIVKNGYVIWQGKNAQNVHGVRSIAASFTSTILGLLIHDGKCSLETRASEYVPSLDAYYSKVTLKHFATMTSGYRAIGDEPLGNYKHGPSMMPFTPDPYPLFPPGSHFAYWDSAINQFANVLRHIAGAPLDQLFSERIARPIGITDEQWKWEKLPADDANVVCGAGNHALLKISSLALARFGLLYLNRGKWNEQQLINENWVEQATQVQVPADIPLSGYLENGPGTYGYNWWINGQGPNGNKKWPDAPSGSFAALGFYNNALFVVPDWNMVVVRTGTNQQNKILTDEIYNKFLGLIDKARTGN